jgi:hypothetical protein
LSRMGRGSLAIEGGTWDRKPILDGRPFVYALLRRPL